MIKCEQCELSIEQLENKYHSKHEWIWTSHSTNRRLCSFCFIEEYEQLGQEVPNNSLHNLNEQRKKP